jgi:hypothetical protein
MTLLKKAFLSLYLGIGALGGLVPASLCASTDVVGDKTLDYECRPRWDKFIVDENTTNWDKNAVACHDKYGNEVNPAKLYGAPKMYGEYEGDSYKSARRMYGTPGDSPDHSRLYGKYDPSYPGIKPKPVRAAAPVAKKSNPKEATKTKPVSKPKAKKIIRQAAPVIAEPAPQPEPVIVAPAPEPVVAQKPVPDAKAQNIARFLNEKIITEESYCTQFNPAVKGRLPKGIVLMPGRPDLMSCVKN